MDTLSSEPLQKSLSRECGSYLGFVSILNRLMMAAWGDNWGIFTHEFPLGEDARNISMPRIVYRIISEEPAELGSVREIKPRIRQIIRDSNNLQEVYFIWGQSLDTILEFNIIATESSTADELTEKLKDLFIIYAGLFHSKGTQQLIYQGQMPDAVVGKSIFEQDVHVRTLRYFIRFERLVKISCGVINAVISRFNIAREDGTITDTIESIIRYYGYAPPVLSETG